jgi:mono/diheme cytochrome c family protein
MKRDFKTWVILLAFSIPLAPMLFLTVIYFSNCGAANNCARGNLAQVIHTPIPTLPAATLPAPTIGAPVSAPAGAACNAAAATLLAAWVNAGSPQSQPFNFTDESGQTCAAAFSDIQPLFTASNLWYPGALDCTSCHNASPNASSAGLDLSSFAGIMARTDILGGGDWNSSQLNQVLFVQKQMPFGAPSGVLTDQGPLIQAGKPIASTSITPAPAVPQVPRPSNPGGPGKAISLTGDPAAGATVFSANCVTCHGEAGKVGVTNPGSTDGTVPALNPIDPLLKNADAKIFAQNIDLFIQNGSTPDGPNPFRTMPAWGDQNVLTQQQIADVIAYLISLNK